MQVGSEINTRAAITVMISCAVWCVSEWRGGFVGWGLSMQNRHLCMMQRCVMEPMLAGAPGEGE